MRIAILVTSISNFGQKGFYNAQEVGLAKALDKFAEEVTVYKLVPKEQEKKCEKIEGTKNARIHFLPARNFGINGFPDTNDFNKKADILIHFSDTQFSVPKVYAWAQKNNVEYIPYIGVTESHSTQQWVRLITNQLFKRNLRIYKKCRILVKTPTVKEKLKELGVQKITVTPVGLDESLLRGDFKQVKKESLKEKYGYAENEKIILFIGRLTEEKCPFEMLDILKALICENKEYRLLMVGKGELQSTVEQTIKKEQLDDYVRLIEQIPNKDIWELYRMADAFVNLNRGEIFGMAILEAMYYGCKAVARHAPGPNFIIENGTSGYLAKTKEEIIDCILLESDVSAEANSRIAENFTWDAIADKLIKGFEEE